MPVKISPDFVVHNESSLYNGGAATTGLADGGFVVIWHEYKDGASSAWGRLYNGAGQPKGAKFQVENVSHALVGNAYYQLNDPLVAALPDGGFAVTFESTYAVIDISGDIYDHRLHGEVFDANGATAGSIFVDGDASTFQQYPYRSQSITALADGRFVVLWSSDVFGDPSNVPSMRAQVHSAGGGKVGGEIVVTNDTIYATRSYVTALAGGGFVVTWGEYTAGTDPGTNDTLETKARIYQADGTAATGEVTIAEESQAFTRTHLLTTASGDGFLAWWNDRGNLVAQRFTADGTATGSEVSVPGAGTYALTALADGRVVAVSSGGQNTFRAQIFDSNGTAAGDSFRINSSMIAALADGRFAVTSLSTTVASSELRTAIVDPYVFEGDTGNDSWIGGKWSDRMDGYGGNDTFKGMGGADVLNGDSGNDTLRGGSGGDKIDGGLGKDFLVGDSGNDIIRGGKGDDRLYGSDGNDKLLGSVGDDTLIGGNGKDMYMYTAVEPGSDEITVFANGLDKFQFEGSAFGLGTYSGTLESSRFDVGTNNFADRTSERFIFNIVTDQLWYDSNGSAVGGLRAMIAKIGNDVTLSASDILIF